MTHPTDDLTALLDGALAPARRAEVERHLQGCAACRAERDRLAGALALLGALPPPPEPSPWFAARLAARLAGEPAPSPGLLGLLGRLGRWRWRLAVPATALAAAAAVTVFAVRAHRAEEEAVAAQLDLLEEYEVVASVGDVETAEDAAVVASLDRLAEAREAAP
jgi:anti-sigma factor RsiW